MNVLTWLHVTIIGQWMALIVWGGIGYFEAKLLPHDLQIYAQSQIGIPTNFKGIVILCAEAVSFVSYVIATIGVLKKLRWSRRIYTYAVVSALFISFLSELRISGPTTNAFEDLNILLMGVTIGILYFSPLNELFNEDGTLSRAVSAQ